MMSLVMVMMIKMNIEPKKIAEIIKKQHIDLKRLKGHSKVDMQMYEAKQTAVAQIREDLAELFEREAKRKNATLTKVEQ